MAALYFRSRFCIHFLFLLNQPPQAYWLKQSLFAHDSAFCVGLARQFSGLRWTHPGSCGHLMAHLTGAGELRTASVGRWGPWCWVWAGPSFHVGSHYSVTYARSPQHGSRSLQRGERWKWEDPSSGTNTLLLLLCFVGQNKLQGQPDSRGGEIVDTITWWKELRNRTAEFFQTTTPLLHTSRYSSWEAKIIQYCWLSMPRIMNWLSGPLCDRWRV